MTRFEYLAIFNGIIVALAIENVAASFHKLFEAGSRVRWHWMAPTNAIGGATATLGQFWFWWLGRDVNLGERTFFTFLPGAMTAILLYLVCAATLPDAVPESGIDLKEFYFSNRRQFWSLVAATALPVSLLDVWSIARANFDPQLIRLDAPVLIGTLVATAIAASMIYVRATWWHALGIITMTAGTLFVYGPMKL